jgi:C4-dicarboxylate transporter DctM subunit
VSVAYFGIAFALMLGMMLLGLPIAVAMAAVGIVGGIAAYGLPCMDSIAPVILGVHNENLLTSIPLFVLLGELLLRSGIADRMYIALSAVCGALWGRAARSADRQQRRRGGRPAASAGASRGVRSTTAES